MPPEKVNTEEYIKSRLRICGGHIASQNLALIIPNYYQGHVCGSGSCMTTTSETGIRDAIQRAAEFIRNGRPR